MLPMFSTFDSVFFHPVIAFQLSQYSPEVSHRPSVGRNPGGIATGYLQNLRCLGLAIPCGRLWECSHSGVFVQLSPSCQHGELHCATFPGCS